MKPDNAPVLTRTDQKRIKDEAEKWDISGDLTDAICLKQFRCLTVNLPSRLVDDAVQILTREGESRETLKRVRRELAAWREELEEARRELEHAESTLKRKEMSLSFKEEALRKQDGKLLRSLEDRKRVRDIRQSRHENQNKQKKAAKHARRNKKGRKGQP